MAKWGFLGCGNLAQAIITGALRQKTLLAHDVYITNRNIKKSKIFRKFSKVNISESNEALISKCEIIVIGVKPLDIATIFDLLKKSQLGNKIIVSLAAGVDLNVLGLNASSATTICRVMANTPVAVGHGVFGIAYHRSKKSHQALIEKVFASLGTVITCRSDQDLDVVTAGAASGVGFIFSLMEEFESFFVQRGFSQKTARKMTVKTFFGTAALAEARSQKTLSQLRDAVTSKKGTTLAGLEVLRRAKVGPSLRSGLHAAELRSQEIAKSLRKSLK